MKRFVLLLVSTTVLICLLVAPAADAKRGVTDRTYRPSGIDRLGNHGQTVLTDPYTTAATHEIPYHWLRRPAEIYRIFQYRRVQQLLQ